MQVKKFEAPTVAEALKLVKSELGPEAIILSTKNHRKGFGLLSKASVEVTAAIAERSLAKKKITERALPQEKREQVAKLPASKQAEIFDEFSDHYLGRHRERKAAKEQKQAATPRAAGIGAKYVDIQDSAQEARQEAMVQESAPAYGRNGRVSAPAQQQRQQQPLQQQRVAAPSPQPQYQQPQYQQPQFQPQTEDYGWDGVEEGPFEAAPAAQDATPATRYEKWAAEGTENAVDRSKIHELADDVQRLKEMLMEIKTEQTALADSKIPESSTEAAFGEFQSLLRNGIDKRYATQLVKQVTFALPSEALRNSDKVTEALALEIMGNTKIDQLADVKTGDGPKVIALIGPTGVGKTTTIAKLASQAILQKNLKVGLINLDSYKVAALDQLATYAKILNVPFRQASNAAELARALAEFKPLDLVLIDTSGRSQKDSDSLVQMKNTLMETPAVRPLLILSATTRDQELYDIVNRFKIFNPNGLVFSKLDETSTFGCIYNISQKTGLPLTYFTVGQRVPEDIETASKERVAALILDL